MATIYQITNLLNKYNIEYANTEQLINFFARFSEDELDKYLAGCIFLKKELNNVCAKVTAQQIHSIINNSNLTMLKNVEIEFNNFARQTKLDSVTAKQLYKSICKDVLSETSKTDKELIAASEKYINDLSKATDIAYSFHSNLDEDIANKLYKNCLKRMQGFYLTTNPAQLQDLIYHLLNNVKGLNKPTTTDLISISERCASFYSSSSAEKIINIGYELQQFSNFIYNKLSQEETTENKLQIMQYKTQLTSKDLRNTLLATPSIFTENPNTIKFNIELIKGETTLGKLFEKYNITPTNERIFNICYNITLNYSAIDMQKLYANNLSALSLSPTVLLNSLNFINKTVNKVFGGSIAPEEYLSAETFSQLQTLNKIADNQSLNEYYYWENNLNLLKGIMPKEKLKEYFLSSFKLANIPTDFIKKQITSTILNSNSEIELESNFDRLIRKNFFWDVQNKDVKKTSQNKASIEVPKYRVGNQQTQAIKFGFSVENASQFLTSLGYNEEIIKMWKSKHTTPQSKNPQQKINSSLDIDTVNKCNEFLNLIREFNNLLNTKPDIPTLFTINTNLTELYQNIYVFSADTRNMSTATKGLIVNVKNSFNDLTARYNLTINKIQTSLKEELRKIKKQEKQLTEQINKEYLKYQKYKDNVPAIIKDYNQLIARQNSLYNSIVHFRNLQEQNRIENFDRIDRLTQPVNDIFVKICNTAKDCLNKALIDLNLANKQSLFKEDILESNSDYLKKFLNINSNQTFTGEIFLTLKQIKENPDLTNLYQEVSMNLTIYGINLDKQLLHHQPENFHGDSIDEDSLSKYLGYLNSEENLNAVLNYNDILTKAWYIHNKYETKITTLESELETIKIELKELNEMISNGYANKQQGFSITTDLENKKQEKQKVEEQLEQLKGMHFNL